MVFDLDPGPHVSWTAIVEGALHVRAAKNNGLTDEEIAEVIQHAAIYAGVPAANHAFKVAAPILEELRAAPE